MGLGVPARGAGDGAAAAGRAEPAARVPRPDAGRIDLVSVGLSLVAVLRGRLWPQADRRTRPRRSRAAGSSPALRSARLFVRRQGGSTIRCSICALFRQPRFSAAIAAYALSCLAMFGVYIFITQYLQLVLGLSPLHAGMATCRGPRLRRRLAGGAEAGHRWPATRVLGGVSWPLASACCRCCSSTRAGHSPPHRRHDRDEPRPRRRCSRSATRSSSPPRRRNAPARPRRCPRRRRIQRRARHRGLRQPRHGALSPRPRPALPAGLSRDVADQAMATLGGAVSAASALTETPARRSSPSRVRRSSMRCRRRSSLPSRSSSAPRSCRCACCATEAVRTRQRRGLIHTMRAERDAGHLDSARPWASSGDAIASLPAGTCLSTLFVRTWPASLPATAFTARLARFTCSSPTKAALREIPRITLSAPCCGPCLDTVLCPCHPERSEGSRTLEGEIPRMRSE